MSGGGAGCGRGENVQGAAAARELRSGHDGPGGWLAGSVFWGFFFVRGWGPLTPELVVTAAAAPTPTPLR